MKKVSILLLVASTLLLQGCFNVIEEIRLNRNGSGTYQITYDMSELLANPMLKEMLKQSSEEEEGEGANDLSSFFSGDNMEKDTLIALKDSPMTQGKDIPEVLNTATMALRISESKELFETVMKFEFKDVSDIDDFFKAMSELSEDDDGGMGMGGMMPTSGLYETQRRQIIRKPMNVDAMVDGMGGAEMMDMMKMMLAGATYKTVYYLPKRVKKTDIEGAKVVGKQVTVTRDYLDIIEGKSNLAGMIKY